MIGLSSDFVKISIEDLPRYSQWPKRLLSLENFDVMFKTEKEVLREFQDDKWGNLLEDVKRMHQPTLLDIERLADGADKETACYVNNEFYLANLRQIHNQHLLIYEDTLRPYLDGASCLVELGAGYGSKIFNLSDKPDFLDLPLYAGEYTKTGCDLISLIGKMLNKRVTVGHCDFRKLKLENMTIPEGAVIFTSYAVHYVPELQNDFVNFIANLKPKVVVHFEPCFEHHSNSSLHGLMCKRYAELNDYTRNLMSVLVAGKETLGISVKTQPNVIGGNPFLPMSIIEWTL